MIKKRGRAGKLFKKESDRKSEKKGNKRNRLIYFYSILIEHMRKTMNTSSSANGYKCEI